MKECIYCTLPEILERTIVENDLARAFPTNIPITPGHVLVIPKRCVAKYEDLTVAEAEAIEEIRFSVIKAIKKALDAEGFNFAWNDGEIAGQSIPHFHLHIVPRKRGDTGVHGYDPRQFLYRPGSRETSPDAELLKVRDLIKRAV